ncbi:MAG: FHA domain-containing protein [Deltaproteobacteria bacterium]|nr:FHA domain-containing protein [Deltaproteobacteria bacterium]
MGRILIRVGEGEAAGAAGRDQKTQYLQATGEGDEAFGLVGQSLEFDALRRFYFQPALLVVDLETLEAQCMVVPSSGTIALGRDPDCEVTIQSDRVSRRHAEVRPRGRSALALRDLNSTNGTTVNNQPLPPNKDVPLRPGDVALLGSNFLLRTFPLGSSPANGGESFLFPLWVFLGQAQAESSHFLRCCHLVSGFEYLARLVTFVDLAAGPPTQSVQPLLGKSKLSMGEWIQAARGALTRPDPGPRSAATLFLRDADGRPAPPKDLLEHLNFAVRWRNDNVGHGAPQGDTAYRRPFGDLADRFREVFELYPAFRDGLIVSAASCRVGADGLYHAQVTVHDPVWGFRRPMSARRTSPLVPGVYLVLPGSDDLVKFGGRLRVAGCPECSAQELFVADGPARTAPFTSPTTNHRADPAQLDDGGE